MDVALGLIGRIEAYYDLVPRVGARVEDLGPFTLFVAGGGGPSYGRPRVGFDMADVIVADVEVVLARQREHGVSEQFEWVEELAPGLAAIVSEAGLTVGRYPLLVLEEAAAATDADGVEIRIATADDPDIPLANAAISAAFRAGGVDVGSVGLAERDARLIAAEADDATRRERIANGDVVVAIAATDDGPIAGGSASPRGDVAELMGIATLPAYRHRGIGMAVTGALTTELRRRNVGLAFLTADSDAVARIYERAGFVRLATACIAERAD